MGWKNRKQMKSFDRFTEYHFLFIEKPFAGVANQVLSWGWSSWWPKESLLNYSGDPAIVTAPQNGMMCQVSLGSGWKKIILAGKIAQAVPGRLLEIEWLSGWIIGKESVSVEERSNGTRVEHRMCYSGSNIFTTIIWGLLMRKRYRSAIQQGLDAASRHFQAGLAKEGPARARG